jgi:small-conductance mechanosensitive channel
MNEAFNHFVDELVAAGVGKDEAAIALIEQMKMIREQLKKERELDNYQRLKLQMIKHIEELKAALKGDPKLIKAFNTFLNTYTKNKEAQLEEAIGLKEEIEDELTEVRQDLLSINTDLATIKAKLSVSKTLATNSAISSFDIGTRHDRRFTGSSGSIDDLNNQGNSLAIYKLIDTLQGKLHGYDWIMEIKVPYLDDYLKWLSLVIRQTIEGLEGAKSLNSRRAYLRTQTRGELSSYDDEFTAEDEKDVRLSLDNLKQFAKDFIPKMRRITKIMNTTSNLIKKTDLIQLATLNRVEAE